MGGIYSGTWQTLQFRVSVLRGKFRSTPSNGTFCDEGNVLDLCCRYGVSGYTRLLSTWNVARVMETSSF